MRNVYMNYFKPSFRSKKFLQLDETKKANTNPGAPLQEARVKGKTFLEILYY